MIGITGATGFVGMTHLAHCIRRGFAVRILVRPSHAYADQAPDGVEVVVGDVGDSRVLNQFADGLDVCFHYAARASFKGDWSKFETVNVVGTENLVSACKDVRRFVLCSTQAVLLADQDIREAEEGLAYPAKFFDSYARSKALAEQIVLKAHSGGCVVRPPWVWGAGDTNNLPTLIKPTLQGRMGYFDGGKNLLETVHVVNLVHAMNLAATSAVAGGKIYFVTDDEPVASKQFSNALLEACGLRAVHRNYPSKVVRAMLWAKGLDGESRVGITRSSFIYMTREQTFSDSAIRAELGYHCPVSRDEGLRELQRWSESIGGIESVCTGRRRGESERLVDSTWAHLMSSDALVDKPNLI